MRQAFFVIIINGAARLSSFKYVGHGFRGHDWCSYLTGRETPKPSPTESTEPHVAFAPLAAVARSPTPPVEREHHEARQEGNLNPAG